MSHFPTLVRAGEPGAPSVVFLPYFGGSARTFTALWPLLPSSWNLRAYTPANIGIGEDGTYSLDIAFEQLARTLKRHVSGPLHLVGHSMCGKIALGAASLGLEGLQSIILLAPSPPSPEPMDEKERQRMLQTHGTREAALETVRGASKRTLAPELLEIAVEDNLATNERDWNNWLQLGSRDDRTNILQNLRAPVKIIVGQGDESMTPDLMTRTLIDPLVALGQPEPPLQAIEGAGHLLPLEAPSEVANWLEKWIR